MNQKPKTSIPAFWKAYSVALTGAADIAAFKVALTAPKKSYHGTKGFWRKADPTAEMTFRTVMACRPKTL
jgi:hypothetical protein